MGAGDGDHACRAQHGDVSDGVVAGAQPDGFHVGVSVAPFPQQRHRAEVHRQRQHADHAHGQRFGHADEEGAIERRAEDVERDEAEGQPLEQRRLGADACGHADDGEREAVGHGVAREIEAVRLQRQRSCRQPAAHFHEEHGGVQHDHQPQHLSVARVRAVKRHRAAGTAARCRGLCFLHAATGCHCLAPACLTYRSCDSSMRGDGFLFTIYSH